MKDWWLKERHVLLRDIRALMPGDWHVLLQWLDVAGRDVHLETFKQGSTLWTTEEAVERWLAVIRLRMATPTSSLPARPATL